MGIIDIVAFQLIFLESFDDDHEPAVVDQRIDLQPQQGLALISSPNTRMVVQQTQNGEIGIVGIEEQHAVLNDGAGGIIVAVKRTASSLSPGGLDNAAQIQFFHITREAIFREPSNPDVILINSTDIERFNMSQIERARITALREK